MFSQWRLDPLRSPQACSDDLVHLGGKFQRCSRIIACLWLRALQQMVTWPSRSRPDKDVRNLPQSRKFHLEGVSLRKFFMGVVTRIMSSHIPAHTDCEWNTSLPTRRKALPVILLQKSLALSCSPSLLLLRSSFIF